MNLSKLKNKKILVTGGAGFIGSNLCEFLINHGSIVSCLDNLSNGSLENINHLFESDKFNFIEGDIRDLETCIKCCKKIDYVLHQAALGSVPRSISDPLTTNDVNISGFLNMLIASRDNNVKRFIYAASSSTYGDSLEIPKQEDKIGKQLSPYAISKYCNELYAENFTNLYGIQTIGIRYFNVFGKRQSPYGEYSAVIPIFINSFLKKKSPIINGDGKISRDFTYIDNVIEMNILSILTEDPNAVNQIYNCGFGESTTLTELAETIKKILTTYDKKIKEVEIIYGPPRKGDIQHSLAMIDKAKLKLGYSPKYSLKKGLKKSISWYINNI